MKSSSADSKTPASVKTAKKASLPGVLKQTEKIKVTVKEAATELTSVNNSLTHDKVPVPDLISQNKKAEQKVAKAADDLKEVNTQLAHAVAERKIIESELAEIKTDLAEVRQDLSKSQFNEELAQQIALQDALTGLPNRLSFEQRLDHGLLQARRHNWGLAVLFIDIDQFKSINDSHGHDIGDQVLVMVAQRLRGCVRAEDMVSRWGGDEFVCLLLEIRHDDDVRHIAEKMISRIAETCTFHGITLSIRASIGIATYPEDGETAESLFKNADTAMYKAKGTQWRVVLFGEAGGAFVG